MLLYMTPNELNEPITMASKRVVVIIDGLVAPSEAAAGGEWSARVIATQLLIALTQ